MAPCRRGRGTNRRVHKTAIIDPGAVLGKDVEVGPFAVIGPNVTIGDGCAIGAHAVVESHVRMGKGTRVSPFASIGAPPQDLKFKGEDTWVEIGEGTTIREYVTVNRGTVGGGGVTRVGSRVLLMAYCHVAHDCQVGDRVIMANAATLAGHITVEDGAFVGGLVGVHQFAHAGSHQPPALCASRPGYSSPSQACSVFDWVARYTHEGSECKRATLEVPHASGCRARNVRYA